MKDVGETVPLSEGLKAICRKRERRAEKRVGGVAGIGGPEPTATVATFPLGGGSSIGFPPSIAESRRRNLRPGGREGGETTGGDAGEGARSTDGIGGLELSGESHTSSRKGWQK
jgi:hypothetical protein